MVVLQQPFKPAKRVEDASVANNDIKRLSLFGKSCGKLRDSGIARPYVENDVLPDLGVPPNSSTIGRLGLVAFFISKIRAAESCSSLICPPILSFIDWRSLLLQGCYDFASAES